MPNVDGADLVEIEQGWIPGERLKERFRRMRESDGRWQLIRGMKLGTGIRRTEVEEACPPELFEKLWPLTAGRRIAKKRYRIADGDLVWEIDQFADRDLVLAEIELPTESTPVTPPPWIAGLIVREVTGEKAFTNEALASLPAPRKAAKKAGKKPAKTAPPTRGSPKARRTR
jgi:CYTH domain-containing protein